MKKIPVLLLMLVTALAVSCTSQVEDIRYEGDGFVLFADSEYVMPVTEAEKIYEIPVGFSIPSDHERTIAVAVDVRQSNAIEGYHFEILNPNVVVPAGKLTGMLQIKGDYAHIESVSDSLCVTLRLLADPSAFSSLYGSTARVHLQKVRPFCIDDYVGNLSMTCTFPFSTSAVTRFNVKSEKVNDSTLVVRQPFDQSRDLVLRFHTGKDDPFDQNIDMREQVAFTDNTFGQVSMSTVEGIPSYYLPENRAFVLYLNAYLAHLGSFGSFYYIFEWISPDQALAEDNGLNTIY